MNRFRGFGRTKKNRNNEEQQEEPQQQAKASLALPDLMTNKNSKSIPLLEKPTTTTTTTATRSFQEEKKESTSEFLLEDDEETTRMNEAGDINDCAFFPELEGIDESTVADLWNQVTWYPIVEEEATSASTFPPTLASSLPATKHRSSAKLYRRWMAIQGSVYQEQTTAPMAAAEQETSRPLFRHPAVFGNRNHHHGSSSSSSPNEPFYAQAWTPAVAALRDKVAGASHFFNHVTLEAWQWNTDEHRSSRRTSSITAVHERVDPTLDLEPGSPMVRIFLAGPLDTNNDNNNNSTISTKDENEDAANSPTMDQSRLGSVYLRPKRYDATNQRRPSPRPQHAYPMPPKSVFHMGWHANTRMTHEISLRPQPAGQVTLVVTFRHVATWLVEPYSSSLAPRLVTRPLGAQFSDASPPTYTTLQSEQDRQLEWKRLSRAFFEEKRQEGLTTAQVYQAGSLLIPQAKVKPCLAKLTTSPTNAILTPSGGRRGSMNSTAEHDVWSVATPTSVANSISSPGVSPLHNLHIFEDTDHMDDDDDDNALNENDNDNNKMLSIDTTLGPKNGPVAATMQGTAIALLVVDLQNDFLGDDPSFSFCRLTHKESPLAGARRTRLLRRIDELAQQVREQQGVVVFCRSVYGRWSQSKTAKFASVGTVDEEGEENEEEEDNTGNPKKDANNGKVSEHDDSPGIKRSDTDSTTSSTATARAGSPLKAGTHLNRDSCCSVGTAGSDFYPDAAKMIQEDDIVMTKQWYSAFLETSLHAQLQRLGVKSVVVCGVTTNHSVSATVRSAAHLGYNVIVSSDGTAQIDPSLQAQTEAKLQKYAAILAPSMSLKEILAPTPVAPRSLGRRGRDRLDFDGWNRLSAVGSGDSFLLPDFFDPTDADARLSQIRPRKMSDTKKSEVTWKPHVERGGRGPLLTAYQCVQNSDGHAPICRLAENDESSENVDNTLEVSDWTPSIEQSLPDVEIQAGHSFNFCRLLYHSSSKDSVRFRSDLCLDLKEDTSIAIVALGDGLVLELRPKPGIACSATAQKIYLRHNTLFLLGPETNRLFQYSIRCSRKAPRKKPRVTLTFRNLVNYWDRGDGILYGPGTRYPSWQAYREECRRRTMWSGAGLVACGASSLTLLNTPRNKVVDSLALAATPVVGAMAIYQYMNYRGRARRRNDKSRLEQTFTRCNWQPLRFSEARHLLLNATDEELFGRKPDASR